MRKKAEADETIPTIMPNTLSSKEAKQNWARLIQKIYEVDPLICPKCEGSMKIVAFIEELYLIEKFYAILDFGIYATMIRRNQIFPILFLIWFMTFLTLKSLSVAGIKML